MSKLMVKDLEEELRSLVYWERFALYLQGIVQSDINIIKHDHRYIAEQKIALFDKWLRKNPTASWKDVIHALEKVEENSLAEEIKKKQLQHRKKPQIETVSKTLVITVFPHKLFITILAFEMFKTNCARTK